MAGDLGYATHGVADGGMPRHALARPGLAQAADWLLRVATDDPSRHRRGQILAFLCLPLFLTGAGFFVFDVVDWLVASAQHAAFNIGMDLLFSLAMATAWGLARRGLVAAGAVLQLTCVSAGLLLFFYYTSPHRIEVLFAVPVVIAAFEVTPWAAFVWAGVSSASFVVMNASNGGESRLSLQVGLALFGLAIVAYFVSTLLERAVAALCRTSEELAADIRARQEAEEERRQVEAALDLSRQQSRTLFEGSSLGVFLFDRQFTVTECNARLAEQMGTSGGQLVGLDMRLAAEQRTIPAMERALAGAVGSYEGPYQVPGGETLWISFAASPLRGPGYEVVGGIGVITDLTDQKQAQDLVEKLAYRDALTGLPNRSLFADRMRQAVAAAERHGQRLVVGVLDIDRFKNVNDTLGHEYGDLLLVGAAERIGGLMRVSDSVARSGGDAFLLLFVEIGGARDAAAVAARILRSMRAPWHFEGKRVYVSACIGLAVYPDDATEASALLENAHTAMLRAKHLGGDTLQFYDRGLSTLAAERLQLESELHAAVEAQQFVVHYQPQVDARDGSVVGVEALVRWQHPRRGLVPPLEFIAVAEETGLIVPLGREVLHAACMQAREWQKLSRRPLRVAVNVSARQLREPGLIESVECALRETGLAPGLLEIEITETATLSHAVDAEAVLLRLRGMGVGVALDDFGTGHSSLSQLRRLPITRLKIDRAFVSELAVTDSCSAIVSAVIDLARALELGVVAEGVETPEQLAFLQRLGCHEVQGYLFSRPLPADECRALVAGGPLEPWPAPRGAGAAPPRPLRPASQGAGPS